jgi:hypothetical protein
LGIFSYILCREIGKKSFDDDFSLVGCNTVWSIPKFSCHLLYAGFLLGLFFNPEDGGDVFDQNIGQQTTQHISDHCENFNPCKSSGDLYVNV